MQTSFASLPRPLLVAFAVLAIVAGCSGGGSPADVQATDGPASDVPATDAAAEAELPDPRAIPADQAFLPTVADGRHWALDWREEFDGTALGQGHLVMDVYAAGGKRFDGEVDTQGKYDRAFGYFEARMSLQRHEGHWPAFWLMPDSFGTVAGTGADGAEIDVMEKPWAEGDKAGFVNHALHWDAYAAGAEASYMSQSDPSIQQGWHTYGLWWTESEYVFYIDGQEVWRTSAGGVCKVPLYLIFSDEIACGPWVLADCLSDDELPDPWMVDYLRVFVAE